MNAAQTATAFKSFRDVRARMGSPDTEAWREALLTHRAHKDEFFADDPQSPLSAADRESFDGLSYFEPDQSYRIVTELDEYDTKETITVSTTTDGERDYLVWGSFAFERNGESVRLDAYRSEPESNRLWVPFRDETSGDETYGAGRYLDLEDPDDREGDAWVLDFNYAYNPFCAYNEQYECPLVPMENWLNVPIRAGEKTFE
ncbi:hypothetical protein C499_17314 [Halogeometricum borinquense DSM 11551]|uniref:DUF1684 domain-containing protein n=3 Tax=Halogeometricum borinquense TaxID=60847 RepID=E4NQ41_HALBP|nr:Protein of unknown function (DUF1684) [Halogeometricum borinquense DSM 11551]ELY23532.1 hypothetical protein C499_17314 [Halogeometricum borinquense DSM 11551]RYJ13266.1 DUF1684 domain-containing protein [Halogeometricum borinquense]